MWKESFVVHFIFTSAKIISRQEVKWSFLRVLGDFHYYLSEQILSAAMASSQSLGYYCTRVDFRAIILGG